MAVTPSITIPAATPAVLGTITIDRAPASGNPIALTPYGLQQQAPARADRALLILGDGKFDASAGAFLGSALGTALGVNVPTGRGGNIFDFQVNGASQMAGDTAGNLTARGTITAATLSATTGVQTPGGVLLSGIGGNATGLTFQGGNAGGIFTWKSGLFMRGDSDTISLWANQGPDATKAVVRLDLSPSNRLYQLLYDNTSGGGIGGLLGGGEHFGCSLVATAYAPSWQAVIAQGAPLQTADLLQATDSASFTQFAVANKGTGAAPVWALRVRALSHAESMAQLHTAGAATGRAIQVIDDVNVSLGFIPLYA